MGTSGAYGGTPSWRPVVQQTELWIDALPAGGAGGEGPSETPPQTNVDDNPPQPAASAQPTRPAVSPLDALVRRIATRLASDGAPGTRGGGGTGAGGGGRRGGGRTATRAARVGGRAIAGAYGLRSGIAAPLADLGLTLAELEGLSKGEQTRRIVEAAMGPEGAIDGNELRLANSEVVLWALTQEIEPTALELANRWVVEYVWQAWITEAGRTLRDRTSDGHARLRVEQEMRAVLEARVAASGLPEDRPLTTADFQAAIRAALTSLARISGAAA